MTGRQGPLRVLVLATTFPARPGDGTPGFVLDLARALAAEVEVTALVPRVPDAPAREVLDGITVQRVAAAPRRLEGLADGAILPNLRAQPWRVAEAVSLVLALLVAALRHVRRHRPDVVHAHWILPAGLIAAVLRRVTGVPYVVTVHGADAYALSGPAVGTVKRVVLRGAAGVAPVSGDIADRLGLDRAGVVPMGIDVDAIAAAAGDRQPEPGRLLLVGRLADKKGVDVALAALARLAPPAHLVVVGDGPEAAALRRQAAALGVADRVQWRGRLGRDEVLDELRCAAVLLLPSRVGAGGDQEGTPVVLGEGMAAGVPIVASRLGGIAEQLDDGRTGLLVPPGDDAALADAVRRTLADPAAASARALAAREAARAQLDLRVTGRRTLALLRAAATAGTRRGRR